jgi:hypothetical protein
MERVLQHPPLRFGLPLVRGGRWPPNGSQMLAFAGQETRTTVGVTNDAFTLRVTIGAWWP